MDSALLPDHDDENYSRPLKRQKTCFASGQNELPYDRYTVAWICALYIETAAAQAMLDETHSQLPRRLNDPNTYTLGSIKNHNVVIASLPCGQYGNNNATNVLSNLTRTFPSITCGLMVGIGGAAPTHNDIRLGDVVVGTRVMQYDLGKTMCGGEVLRTAIPKTPGQSLCTAVTNLRASHEKCPTRIVAIIQEQLQRQIDYHRTGAPDRLFQASYKHNPSMANCDSCDQSQLERREPRRSCEPKIHYGAIASGNQVMKDAATRDRLAQELDVICFEMEAAGLMDILPCLPIRGICDYSDSHKAKDWQKYAAAVAAAYAREFLEALPAADNAPMTSWPHARPDPQIESGTRRQTLLKSLEFDQIDSRRTTIKTAYSKTCTWFLRHPEYLAWLDSQRKSEHHGFLWIRGKPGAGKSIIMKFIYTKMRKADIANRALTISFFFNARGESLEKSVSGMYRSLLLQLLEGYSDLQLVLEDPDLIPRNQVTCPPLHILKDLFRSAISSLGTRALTCFVDALDECDEQQVRDMVEFFEEVAEQCVEDNMKFQMCFSSRHYPYIDIKSGIRLTLEGQDGHNEDLKRYISKHLRIKDAPLVEELTQMMIEKAAGVFLWVALVVDILNDENRHGRISLRTRLREVPNELSALFQDILTRDRGHLERLLLSVLWILLAERPLQPGEYYHALWSGLLLRQKGDPEMPPVDSTDISDCFNKFVISSSKGLAEITKSKKPTVQFIHESVRDFLIKDKGLYKIWPNLTTDWKSQGHEELKLCCNTYVFHETVRKALDERDSTHVQVSKESLLEQFPFLEYASQFVLQHADAAAHEITQQKFLSEFPVSNWIPIFNIFEKHKIRKYDPEADILYILAERGYANLIRTNLEISPGIEGSGGRYQTPLLAAMAKGNKDSITALLGLPSRICHGVDITDKLVCKVDSVRKGQTRFSWACEEGHLAIAQLLSQNGARVDEADLVRVTHNGHSEIAKMLLDMGANVRIVNKDRRTALHGALSNYDLEIAKILLDKGADATAVDHKGVRPLHEASRRGCFEYVKIILEKGADVNAATKYGWTPLHQASGNDSLETVKVLLDKGAYVNAATEHGRTPLHLTESWEITTLLLEKGADVTAKDKRGRTPLHETKSSKITTLLLKKGADITAIDRQGWTPLHYASFVGRLEVVKVLLEKGADITAMDNRGQTPYQMARGGNPEIARILSEKAVEATSAREVI